MRNNPQAKQAECENISQPGLCNHRLEALVRVVNIGRTFRSRRAFLGLGPAAAHASVAGRRTPWRALYRRQSHSPPKAVAVTGWVWTLDMSSRRAVACKDSIAEMSQKTTPPMIFKTCRARSDCKIPLKRSRHSLHTSSRMQLRSCSTTSAMEGPGKHKNHLNGYTM